MERKSFEGEREKKASSVMVQPLMPLKSSSGLCQKTGARNENMISQREDEAICQMQSLFFVGACQLVYVCASRYRHH